MSLRLLGNKLWDRVRSTKSLLEEKAWERKREKIGLGWRPIRTKCRPENASVSAMELLQSKAYPLEHSVLSKNGLALVPRPCPVTTGVSHMWLKSRGRPKERTAGAWLPTRLCSCAASPFLKCECTPLGLSLDFYPVNAKQCLIVFS